VIAVLRVRQQWQLSTHCGHSRLAIPVDLAGVEAAYRQVMF
jgi:hypothetical protein